MAFLCPSRLGRSKQRREIHSDILEKISGDVGFDPLVKFELARYNANNPEAVRIILHNFTTCSPDELTVRQGQKVHILFREGDWAYVLTADKKEGFIPFTACAKLVAASSKKPTKTSGSTGNGQIEHNKTDRINNNTYNVKNDKSVVIHHIHNEQLHVTDNSLLSTDWSNDSHKHEAVISALKTKCVSQSSDRYDDNRNIIKSYLKSSPYEKLPKFLEVFNSLQSEDGHVINDAGDSEISPRTRYSVDTNESSFISETSTEFNNDDTYVALFDFKGRHREDVDVGRDETVVVLEKSDPFWYWVRKRDGSEGYVPSNYIGQLNDPKIMAILEERHKREPGKSGHSAHHAHCRCPECVQTSPITDSCSVASSTLNSETKTRPPKPPRTRIKTPKDSTQSSKTKTKSSSRKHNNSDHREHKTQSASNTSKFSSHHLSLENVSVVNDKQGRTSSQMKPSESSTDLHHSRKKSSRHRRPNYREYRSHSTRSYTFEESTDYFDAYFCDEPDPYFKPKSDSKTDVINVAEILKHRHAVANKRSFGDGKAHQTKTWMKNGSTDNGHNILNLRQYMQTLPSTAIGGEQEIHNETQADIPASKASKQHESKRGKREKRSSDHQRLDWSFGYPRKQRSNHNSRCSSTPDPNIPDIALPKGDKRIGGIDKGAVKTVGSQTDLKDAGVLHNALEDPSDQMFLDLLNATDNLLEVSEKILSSNKAKVDTADSVVDNKGDRRSSSSETDDDVNEKCSHFIMNQVIDTNAGQLTNRSETSYTATSDISETRGINISTNENNIEWLDDVFKETQTEDGKHLSEIDHTFRNGGRQLNQFQNKTKDTDIRNNNSIITNNFTTEPSSSSGTSKDNESNKSKVRTSDNSSKKSSVTNDPDEPVDDPVNYMDVRGVTEFVVQYDYEPEPDSELAIRIFRNEILHISLDIQEDENWYWAFSPRLRTYGYVPRLYVKIPLVTII